MESAHTEPTEDSTERIDYLRSRGVEIELPEERGNAEAAARDMQNLVEGMKGTRSFKYVRIPANDAEPLEECTGVIYDDIRGAGDQMKHLLAPKFTSGHVDADALKKTTLHQMSGANSSDPQSDLLSQLTPDMVARQGASVESFRLSDTVNMYLDEVGALKRLIPNKRASAMAAQCGYGTGVPFCGDLYIGRLCHTLGPEPLNVSFNLEDMSPEAPWIQSAAVENLAHQAEHGGGRGGMSGEELASAGGDGDGYKWTQDETDIELTVELPPGTKAKQVKVAFNVCNVQVAVATGATMRWELYEKVSVDDCTWTIDNSNLVISMEKNNEGTWMDLIKDGGFSVLM